jgi:hypothetical protein
MLLSCLYFVSRKNDPDVNKAEGQTPPYDWKETGVRMSACWFTAHHILFECEALGLISYSGFELEIIHQEPIKPLLDLIKKAGIFDGILALPRGA